MTLIKEICSWLCFFQVKSFIGCIVGMVLVSPIGFFFALVVGAMLGGGWSAELGEFLTIGKHEGWIEGIVVIIGATIGFGIVFLLLLIIGANIGNFLGYGITKLMCPIHRKPGIEN